MLARDAVKSGRRREDGRLGVELLAHLDQVAERRLGDLALAEALGADVPRSEQREGEARGSFTPPATDGAGAGLGHVRVLHLDEQELLEVPRRGDWETGAADGDHGRSPQRSTRPARGARRGRAARAALGEEWPRAPSASAWWKPRARVVVLRLRSVPAMRDGLGAHVARVGLRRRVGRARDPGARDERRRRSRARRAARARRRCLRSSRRRGAPRSRDAGTHRRARARRPRASSSRTPLATSSAATASGIRLRASLTCSRSPAAPP